MMKNQLPIYVRLSSAFALAALLLALPANARAQGPAQTSALSDPADPQIQADLNKLLDKKQFHNVKATVDHGLVTLSGTVDLLWAKEDADKRAHKARNISGVDNRIQVAGPAVEDATLRNRISEKLTYDRVGYGTTAFNAIGVEVQNGVVTLGGVAYGPDDKASAIALVEYTPGVKDLVDNLEVAPPSPMDDRIRVAEARAIYGFPSLSKYALDPAKPIRITVVNGKVTLNGVVDTQADKDTANIRANGVPGTFAVVNNLQVAPSTASR